MVKLWFVEPISRVRFPLGTPKKSMAEIIQFPGAHSDRGKKPESLKPLMREGVFYDVTPPSNIKGKFFDRVQCVYQVLKSPNEYVVRGIPQGGTEIESFILQFKEGTGIHVTESRGQHSKEDTDS